jgi:hypothetical protein
LIPTVGTLTCVLIYVSVLAAVVTMRRLRLSYHSRFGTEERDLPPVQTHAPVRLFGYSAPVLLPLVFIIVWLIIWIRGLA